MRRAISRAREVVVELADDSDQTYDLALAILFLARCQQGRRGEADALIQNVGAPTGRRRPRRDLDLHGAPKAKSRRTAPSRSRRREPEGGTRRQFFAGQGDNSNTQFALLGLWAAGRHGYDSDEALESIDRHFRSSQLRDGRWGYRLGMPGTDSMTCAGLMGLAIAASRPSLAERQTARARGACPGRRSRVHRGIEGRRPRCPPCQSPFRHLLPVVARAGLRGAGPAVARWIRLVRPWRSHPDRAPSKTTAAGPTTAGEGCPGHAWRSSSCARRTSRSKSIACSGCRARRAILVS